MILDFLGPSEPGRGPPELTPVGVLLLQENSHREPPQSLGSPQLKPSMGKFPIIPLDQALGPSPEAQRHASACPEGSVQPSWAQAQPTCSLGGNEKRVGLTSCCASGYTLWLTGMLLVCNACPPCCPTERGTEREQEGEGRWAQNTRLPFSGSFSPAYAPAEP